MSDNFNEVYLNIINESLGKAIKNFATLKWTKNAKNEELYNTIEKALNNYGFDVLNDSDDDEEDLADYSKVEVFEGKKSKKFIKIILHVRNELPDGKVQYSIKAVNALSGKRVKISSRNLILKPSNNENEIINIINKCIRPVKLTSEDHEEEAKAAKEAMNKKPEKSQQQVQASTASSPVTTSSITSVPASTTASTPTASTSISVSAPTPLQASMTTNSVKVKEPKAEESKQEEAKAEDKTIKKTGIASLSSEEIEAVKKGLKRITDNGRGEKLKQIPEFQKILSELEKVSIK